MNTELENKIDQLIAVLDEDIRHIEDSLLRLDRLRGLVIKRDDVGLNILLEDIRSASSTYTQNELRRKTIREDLARMFDCDVDQMTLSWLQAELDDPKRSLIIDKKRQLRSLAGRLKKEHISTSMLLADCSRFNSMLLRGIFNLGNSDEIYYGADGAMKQQRNTAFVNTQF